MLNNLESIDLKFRMINSLLIGLQNNVLDISYVLTKSKLIIQIVILERTDLDKSLIEKIKDLKEYKIEIIKIFISKKKFNENKGNWQPQYYKWLPIILFSKAEVL